MFKTTPTTLSGRVLLEILRALNGPSIMNLAASPTFNYAISRNRAALEVISKSLQEASRPTPEMQKFLSERQEIDVRYGERDPRTRELVQAAGGGFVIGNVAAWKLARGEHDQANKEMAAEADGMEARMEELLAKDQEVSLIKIPLENFPSGLPNIAFDAMMPLVEEPEVQA